MFLLATIFSDHAVLQRDRVLRVFGEGTPNAKVVVRIPEKEIEATCTVQADGKWMAILPPVTACNNCTLCAESENVIIQRNDIAFGEVWIAGGQSNMEFMLKNEAEGEKLLQECSSSNVRYYMVPQKFYSDADYIEAMEKAHWDLPSAEHSKDWSAVGYLAAKEIAEKLGVTVGVIGCNFGGSSVTNWMAKEDLEAHLGAKPYLDAYIDATAGKTEAEMVTEYDAYVEYHTAWEKRMMKCYEEDGNMAWEEILRRCGENRYPGPMNCKSPYRPSGLYETMLRTVVPYSVQGAFYYQGENDDIHYEAYATLLKTMIARWRSDFENEVMPFVLVQLPMFAYEDTPENGAWPGLRAAQLHVSRTVTNVGLAVALDCGEMGNIHPTHKQEVAHRVALQALSMVYHKGNTAPNSPTYLAAIPDGEYMTVCFQDAECGLELRGEPRLFELAGEDGIFHQATVDVVGSVVLLHSDAVQQPRYARYAWVNYGPVTLYGKNGLPVAPFSNAYKINESVK